MTITSNMSSNHSTQMIILICAVSLIIVVLIILIIICALKDRQYELNDQENELAEIAKVRKSQDSGAPTQSK